MRTQSHRGIFESSNGKSDRAKWLVFGQHSRKQKLMLRQPTQRSTLMISTSPTGESHRKYYRNKRRGRWLGDSKRQGQRCVWGEKVLRAH